MAGDDRANLEFQQILSRIDRKFEIIHAKWSDQKNFEVKFRSQIPRDSEDFNGLCDEWVEIFSDITNTVWAKKISNTGPKIRFRKQYQCWTHAGKIVHKELLFDARKCRGTLDIKVLTDNPQTRRKNKHIKLGLNIVVKINFMHLHVVDTQYPFAFFVHNCEPQAEPPRPIVQSNDKLPKIISDIVAKNLNTTAKSDVHQNNYINNTNKSQNNVKLEGKKSYISMPLIEDKLGLSPQLMQAHTIQNIDQIHLNTAMPLQGIETIKLQVQPSLQPLTQVVVSAPQIDMAESLVMCQPLMFDPTQIIPVTTHALPHHFVHTHNIHNQQGHYL